MDGRNAAIEARQRSSASKANLVRRSNALKRRPVPFLFHTGPTSFLCGVQHGGGEGDSFCKPLVLDNGPIGPGC